MLEICDFFPNYASSLSSESVCMHRYTHEEVRGRFSGIEFKSSGLAASNFTILLGISKAPDEENQLLHRRGGMGSEQDILRWDQANDRDPKTP